MSPLPSPAFRFRAKLHRSKKKTTPSPKLNLLEDAARGTQLNPTSPVSRDDTESPEVFARLPYRALRRQGALLYIPKTPSTPTPSGTCNSVIDDDGLKQYSTKVLNTNSAAVLTTPGLAAVDHNSKSPSNEVVSSGGSVSVIAAFELPSMLPHIRMRRRFYDFPKDTFTLLKIEEFDPKVASGSDAFFLLRLDDPEDGLSEAQFLRLLAKCGACKNILTKRSIPHHECLPRDCVEHNLQNSPLAPAGPASQLLDAFMPGGEYGISTKVFTANFVRCMDCQQFLTRRASCLHNCKLEQEFQNLAATYGLTLL